MKPDHCRSCGAPIRWAITAANGKSIPLDRDPVDGGNVILVEGVAYMNANPDLFTDARYVSHFATCPEANRWRQS